MQTKFFGEGYPVEAIKHVPTGGILGGTNLVTAEIARLTKEKYAKELVEAISKAWIEGQAAFDVVKWISEYNA